MTWDSAPDCNDNLALKTFHIVHQTRGERLTDAGKLSDKVQFPFGMASPKAERGRSVLSVMTAAQLDCRP